MSGDKRIVTLRSAPSETVEVPPRFEFKDGEREVARSCFGALRLFPGVPKTVTADELEFVERERPAIRRRLEVREYVESRRVDRRGMSEADLTALAKAEGLEHLSHSDLVARLRASGRLPSKESKN